MLDKVFRRNVSIVLFLGLLAVTGVFYSMDIAAEALEDGVYTGSAEGYKSDIKVEVTVEDERISEVVVLEHDETPAIADSALESLIEAVVASQSVDVDVVSGATATSEAFLKAVRRALGIIDVEDGEYEGSAAGYKSDIKVKVTVSDGSIASVEILEQDETPGLSDPAFERIPQAIVDAQSINVDTVSGATETSKGVINAVIDALDL